MQKNHSTPQGLKTFLSAIKSEIMDQKNRNEEVCNLPVEEIQALKELIKLQRDRVKPCDKGAGIMVLNFNSYMESCYEHLMTKQSESQAYYKKWTIWN